MSDAEKLLMLKHDLELMTVAHDKYLETLLRLAKAEIEREGINLGEDIESDMAVIQYAAYLFRKRAGAETAMPRYLRWQLNNMLMSQKGKSHDVQ